MPALSNPYSALLRRADLADAAGEEPWLFRSEGWDWRWHSWGEIARQATAWAGHLVELPAVCRAAFLYIPRPESVALDLAIQGAGLVSVPVGGEREEIAEWGCRWIEAPPPDFSHRPPPDRERGEAGGAVVVIGGSPVEVGAQEMMAMVERVQAEIAPARRAGEREIVVLGGALKTPEERAMLSWATVTGAAVALEPSTGARIATAAWVRPTLFHGTPEEISALRAGVKKRGPRRLPLGRLRTVLVVGSEKLGEEDREFWQELGVRVGSLPAFLPPLPIRPPGRGRPGR